MHWEPKRRWHEGDVCGYELREHDQPYAVGVYGPKAWADSPPAYNDWHLWKNGRIISESPMTLEEAKALAEVLLRMGEV